MKSLIQKLVETPGPSGYETQIRDVVRAEVTPLVDDVLVDPLGSLIAIRGKVAPATAKAAAGLRVMIAAHIDEIGIIATHIDEQGFVRFFPIGGVHPITCLAGRVRFLNGVLGVIGAERPSPATDISRMADFEHMYIDVGASSRKDCPVHVGEVGVFERPFQDMGKRLISKAMDDRVGAAVLIDALHQLHEEKSKSLHQIYAVFSTQEEVGTRGATTAAYDINPDLGLAIDVTGSGDTPKGPRMDVHLGKGPAIKVRDQGMLSDPRVVDWMVKTAEKERIPYQLEILERGSTDARAIQLTRAGVPAGCISIPCRYVHSPSEMVDHDDVQNAARLLAALLRSPIKLA